MTSTDPTESTITDLSHLGAGPFGNIAPTNQHAGNRPSVNYASTAPGSASPSIDEGDETEGPFVAPVDNSARETGAGRAEDQQPGPLHLPRPVWTTNRVMGPGARRKFDAITGRD